MKKYKQFASDVGERFRSGTNDLVRQGRKDFHIPPIIAERSISTKWANDDNFSNFSSMNTPRMFHSRLAGYYDPSDLEEERLSDLVGSSVPGRVDSAAYRSFLKLEGKDNSVDPGYFMRKTDFKDSLYGTVNNEGYDNTDSVTNRIQMIGDLNNSDRDIDRKDELFINVIQPGVYSINDVTESIGNNFGINESRTNHNISLVQSPETEEEKMKRQSIRNVAQPPAVEDVYDPRNSSYGPSYRRYFEPNSGEVRYFYDDINAVRVPNYITRNHLDMFSFADTTGAQRQASVNGLGSVRQMAEDTWHNSQVDFRTDLQARLLRKTNSQAWQRRIAPIRTL
jgi:hypothetical protein